LLNASSGPPEQGPGCPKRNGHEAAKYPLEGQGKKAERQRYQINTEKPKNAIKQNNTLPITK
jgi:hypothetical protein